LLAYGRYVPYLRGLLRSGNSLIQDAIRNSQFEFEKGRIKNAKSTFEDDDNTRSSLLTSLVNGKDEETGEMLDLVEIVGEAVSFVVAASHSTAASMSFLFAVLLIRPQILRKVREEVDENVALNENTMEYDGKTLLGCLDLRAKLPYLSAVLKESLRMYPTVDNLLARDVLPGGVLLSDTKTSKEIALLPNTVISTTAFALHRNVEIWGQDADVFRPERWMLGEKRLWNGKVPAPFWSGTSHVYRSESGSYYLVERRCCYFSTVYSPGGDIKWNEDGAWGYTC
jgi:cytochrome P450/NADPH-cytochrome P450 reductase